MEYDKRKYPMILERTTPPTDFFYEAHVPCRVVGTTAKRIRIAALMMNRSETYLTVPLEKLRHDPCECFNACRVIDELKEKLA